MANQAKINDIVFSIGDKIKVLQKIQEGDKTRLQSFEGVVISIKGEKENKMFTVRKIATGSIGVERIWPLNSPWIESIKVLRQGKARRAKLYFLRNAPNKLKFVHETEKSKKPQKKSRAKTGQK